MIKKKNKSGSKSIENISEHPSNANLNYVFIYMYAYAYIQTYIYPIRKMSSHYQHFILIDKDSLGLCQKDLDMDQKWRCL